MELGFEYTVTIENSLDLILKQHTMTEQEYNFIISYIRSTSLDKIVEYIYEFESNYKPGNNFVTFLREIITYYNTVNDDLLFLCFYYGSVDFIKWIIYKLDLSSIVIRRQLIKLINIPHYRFDESKLIYLNSFANLDLKTNQKVQLMMNELYKQFSTLKLPNSEDPFKYTLPDLLFGKKTPTTYESIYVFPDYIFDEDDEE